MLSVPSVRVRALNDAPVRRGYVLYWMTACRRTGRSFALDRAVDRARELGAPLVVLEALRVDYPHASDRLHRFVIRGMADNHASLSRRGVLHYAYVEPERGAGRGLLAALAARAAVVVTDDFPCFFLPRMADAASRRIPVRLEAVDGNGLLPMYATDRLFTTAASFRRFLQRALPEHLACTPRRDSLAGRRLAAPPELPEEVLRRWPVTPPDRLDDPSWVGSLPIDHDVPPVRVEGGRRAGLRRMKRFLADGLGRFAERRNHPDDDATSGLSPWLHFGHVSVHDVFAELSADEGWSPEQLPDRPTGSRTGWWSMSEGAEALLEQLVTWREIGFNMCAHQPRYDAYDTLPTWARTTLDAHREDPRPYRVTEEQLERAATEDPVWNAAQRQLLREGRIHGYMRMLWGKKILQWSSSPEEALRRMLRLNDRWALDGRDPNSVSGIFWVLGRYDRAWGPERPIFGKVRFMSSEAAVRKLRIRRYLDRFGAGSDHRVGFDGGHPA